MSYLVKNILSIVEWTALLSFPIILLGYQYRRSFKAIVITAILLTIFSLVIRLTPLHLAIIIALQVVVLLISVKVMFKANYLETLVITGIGYGFYVLIQLLIVEFIMAVSTNSYFDVIFSNLATPVVLQCLSLFITISICFLLQKFDYHLTELRFHLKARNLNKKIKSSLIINSVLTYAFICLAVFSMLANDIDNRQILVLMCISVLFIILSVFHIIYNQFQAKRIIEAKKLYLDQDQQTSTIVERIITNSANHYQALFKLSERNSIEAIKGYIEKEQLNKRFSPWITQNDLRAGLESLDELVYALLINKRKLARMLGVIIKVSSKIDTEVPVSLRQIKYLSMIVDDLILLLYEAPSASEKKLVFDVLAMGNQLTFKISTTLSIDEKEGTKLKLFDALMKFQEDNAIVKIELKPVKLVITCPIM